ncbi:MULTISPECIES: hypothetical protein [unclassified Mesorhizobium]|uniref:hypothetical protein n=1 Tax=unclassified Mesorhizobium TaxID=325217 RepID=UPI001FDFC573|nr:MULTISPECIES: hypothetical protein [unclassified Mesorhizobium]
MRLIRNVLALIVLGIGVLWSLQGLGLVQGSFMTGQREWLYVGLVTMLVGLARPRLGEPLARVRGQRPFSPCGRRWIGAQRRDG